MYIYGKYVCDTLEDTVRDLNKNGKFDKKIDVEYLEYNLTGFIYRPELYYAEIK